VNGYSAGYSPIAYENNLLPLKEQYGGQVRIGELAIEESVSKTIFGSNGGNEPKGRLLPCGIFARWSAK
jgi:hypothetical protein